MSSAKPEMPWAKTQLSVRAEPSYIAASACSSKHLCLHRQPQSPFSIMVIIALDLWVGSSIHFQEVNHCTLSHNPAVGFIRRSIRRKCTVAVHPSKVQLSFKCLGFSCPSAVFLHFGSFIVVITMNKCCYHSKSMPQSRSFRRCAVHVVPCLTLQNQLRSICTLN